MSEKLQKKARIGIITASDRASRGEYEDISGNKIKDMKLLGIYTAQKRLQRKLNLKWIRLLIIMSLKVPINS